MLDRTSKHWLQTYEQDQREKRMALKHQYEAHAAERKTALLKEMHEFFRDLRDKDTLESLGDLSLFRKILKLATEDYGVTQAALHAKTKLSIAAIGKWLRDDKPSAPPPGYRPMVIKAVADVIKERLLAEHFPVNDPDAPDTNALQRALAADRRAHKVND